MPASRTLPTRPHLATLTFLLGLAGACAPADSGDTPARDGNGAAESAPGAMEETATSAEALGTGTVTYAGREYPGFAGSCELSRRNGREDMGELSNLEGIVISVQIDNVESSPAVEMNFVAYSSLDFTMVYGAERLRGTLSELAYESALTPRGTSQAIATVAFTGETTDGASVTAHVVCEIQNEF